MIQPAFDGVDLHLPRERERIEDKYPTEMLVSCSLGLVGTTHVSSSSSLSKAAGFSTTIKNQ
jgi:hypothetical protein